MFVKVLMESLLRCRISVRWILEYLAQLEPLLDSDGRLFTEQEIMSGDYMTKFPGVEIC